MIARYIEQAFAEAEQPKNVSLKCNAASLISHIDKRMVCLGIGLSMPVPTGNNEHEEAQAIINALHTAIGNVSAWMPSVTPVVLHGSVGGFPSAVEE